jgi:hypothetical protein
VECEQVLHFDQPNRHSFKSFQNLLKISSEINDRVSLDSMCSRTIQLCFVQFIEAGAPMEVNITAKAKKSIKDSIAKLKQELSKTGDEEYQVPTLGVVSVAADARTALCQAYVDVRRLIAMDSWRRFEASSYFRQASCMRSVLYVCSIPLAVPRIRRA